MHDVVRPDTYENLAISEKDNGLYVVTLNRPAKRNALDVATIEELIRFFSGARMAGGKAVVLAGEGERMNGIRNRTARMATAKIRKTDCQGIAERSASAMGGPRI